MANKKKQVEKPDIGALKPNEVTFCAVYVSNGRNATRAYMTVYPNCTEPSARSKGYLWTTKVHIQDEIQRLTDIALRREHLSADAVLTEMARLASSDIGDLTWKPGELDSAGQPTIAGTRKPLYELPERVRRCIASLKVDRNGEYEVKLWDKPSQITNLGHHKKLLTKTIDVNLTGFAEGLRKAREKRLNK